MIIMLNEETATTRGMKWIQNGWKVKRLSFRCVFKSRNLILLRQDHSNQRHLNINSHFISDVRWVKTEETRPFPLLLLSRFHHPKYIHFILNSHLIPDITVRFVYFFHSSIHTRGINGMHTVSWKWLIHTRKEKKKEVDTKVSIHSPFLESTWTDPSIVAVNCVIQCWFKWWWAANE